MQYTDIHIHLQATHNVCIALICDTVYSLLYQLNLLKEYSSLYFHL